MYDSLIGTNPALQLIPALATSWETADPTSLVLKLRQGVTFHDGTSFDATAVKFNLDRILQTPSSPRTSEITGVESVQVIDPATVKLSLKNPFSPLLAQLVDRAGMVLSPTAIQKLGDALAQNPQGAGSGPFKFVEWKKDDHITLDRNADYWRKDQSGGALPYLDRLIIRPIVDETQRFNSLRTGEIDFADTVAQKDVAAMKQDPSLTYVQIPALSFFGYYLNCAQEPFADIRVRQALAWSIDRQQIVDTVYFKIPVVSNGPIAPPQFPYDASFKPYSRDIAKAKGLLAQAGHPTVTFTMLVTAGQTVQQQHAELVKDQIKDAGFTLNIQQLDLPTISGALTKHDFQAALIGWTGRLDPDGNTYTQFHTGGGNNYGQYTNPAMDQALDAARQTSDQGQRKTLYQQVNKLAADDAPYVFIYHDMTGQYSTAKVKHFTPIADGIYRFVDVWKQT
jgi:peptide/nickel transport system substrate-binding protein